MAALQKTFSGDLTQFIAGKIYAEVKKYDDERRAREADRKVVNAQKELLKEDDKDLPIVVDDDVKGSVSRIFGRLSADVVATEGKVDDVSAKITTVASAMVDQQKLIINQNAMLEEKFSIMLDLLGGGDGSLHGISTGGGGRIGGSGKLIGVGRNTGDWMTGVFGKALLSKAGRRLWRSKLLQRPRVATKMIRRATGKFAKRTITNITKRVGMKSATKVLTRSLGKAFGKKVPLIGFALGMGYAAERLKEGDWFGAGLEFLSGAISTFPGKGTLVSLGLDAILLERDLKQSADFNKGYEAGYKEGKKSSPYMQGGSRTIQGYESGTPGTDVMGSIERAGQILVSSVIPVATLTGALPAVRAAITDKNLDYDIVRLQAPSGMEINRGSKLVANEPIVKEEDIAMVPEKLAKKPVVESQQIIDENTDSDDSQEIVEDPSKNKKAWWDPLGVFTGKEDTNNNDSITPTETKMGGDTGGPGPIVGRVGTTGSSTGPHIHIERGDGYQRPREGDPNSWKIPQHVWDNVLVNGKSLGSFPLSSDPGDRTNPVTGQQNKFHAGYDIPFEEGSPITLTGGLKLIEYDAGYNAGFGNSLIIQDTDGQKYLLGHLISGPEVEPSKGGGTLNVTTEELNVTPPPLPPLPPVDVTMKSRRILDASSLMEDIEEPSSQQPVVILNNVNTSSQVTVFPRKSKSTNNLTEEYRFLSLGQA